MTSFIRNLYDFFLDHDEALNHLPAILDQQAAEQSLGGVRFSNEWLQQRTKIDLFLKEHTDESLTMALKIFGTSHSLCRRFVVHLTPQGNTKNLFVFCVFFFFYFSW